MMNCKVKIVWFFTLFTFLFFESACAEITDYKVISEAVYLKTRELRIAIRQFKKDKGHFYLIVNPYTYKTSLVKKSEVNFWQEVNKSKGQQLQGLDKNIKETPYIRTLWEATRFDGDIENGGLKHSSQNTRGYFLTVDMCPSRKPFEKEFFHTLKEIGKSTKKGFPVAIAITGRWILDHPEEFQWLIESKNSKGLDITWVNHSFNHTYNPNEPAEKNFLLTPNTNLKEEILSLELLLLKNNQIPSVFVRFPGLVADKEIMDRMRTYGLIPLGADYWLGVAHNLKSGSIFLVHGNSNAPEEILDVMNYLRHKRTYWLDISHVARPNLLTESKTDFIEGRNSKRQVFSSL